MFIEGEKHCDGSIYISEDVTMGEQVSYDEMVLVLNKELSWDNHRLSNSRSCFSPMFSDTGSDLYPDRLRFSNI